MISLKKLLNFIDNDYKESESIVKTLPLAYLMVILFFLFKQNLITWGFLLAAIGGSLNWFVISINRGKMPVLVKNREEFNDALKRNPNRKVCMVTRKTKFSWLSDRFYLLKSWFSIGDFTAVMGVALLIINLIINIK